MLLYNHRKEFIGIDHEDLETLGFQNINELLEATNDFADLFVKKPGYIHNFKNFSWIDFILHSEADESKAIIHAKGNNFACSLHIELFHFRGEENGFSISVRNLRALKGAEDAQATKDLEASGGVQSTPAPAPEPTPEVKATIPESVIEEKPQYEAIPEPIEQNNRLDVNLDDIEIQDDNSFAEEELPNFDDSSVQELSEPDTLEIPQDEDSFAFDMPKENEFGAPLDINYDSIKADEPIKEEFQDETPSFEVEEPIVEDTAPMLGDYVNDADSEHLSDLVKSGDYKYNPQIAADELGLPVDLIEEFIGDFILQAHDFNEDLYASVNGQDYDNVQVLSHKLKGVAANLRIEDAFDVLGVINSSKDLEEIMPNLNQFYRIIAKLEGKELPSAPVAQAPIAPIVEPIESDIYDDLLSQVEVPDIETPIIEIPEPVEEEDIYADLLADPSPEIKEDIIQEEESLIQESTNDDLYDDLLSSPELETPIQDDMDLNLDLEIPQEANLDDDIYDDLLATSPEPSFDDNEALDALPEPNISFENITEPELGKTTDFDLEPDFMNDDISEEILHVEPVVETKPEVSLNFDAQRSANELGIPLDIVNEFVQDFKEQILVHQSDFDNAILSSDIKGVNKTATLLKGMSDNLRLSDISEVLQRLQKETDVNATSNDLAILQAYSDQL